MQRALLRAIADQLAGALGSITAAQWYAGNATQAATVEERKNLNSSTTYVYTLSVGLPIELQTAAAARARRGRALAGGRLSTVAAMGGLLDSGYLQRAFFEAGVPESDNLFTSGALSLRVREVAAPPPAPAAVELLGGVAGQAGLGAGAAACAAALVLRVRERAARE